MASTSQSAPESKAIVVDDEDGNRTSLTKSNSTLESSENVDTLNLLELYNKYEEAINKIFKDKSNYEAPLVRGKLLSDNWRKAARDNENKTVCLKSGRSKIEVVMIGGEDVKDKLTFPTFSACIAYNYYEKVVSKMNSLKEMIIPSLITGCSTLPIKGYLKYNKLFCLAVTGVHFIPKMMKNAGKSVDLIGGVFTICYLIDYTQYKKKHPDDNVEFKTFIEMSGQYVEELDTFRNALRNYGENEFLELSDKKDSSYMLRLYTENVDPLLELYNKYEEDINEMFVNKSDYETVLKKGNLLNDDLRKAARDNKTRTICLSLKSCCRDIEIVMIGGEDVKDKLTFPTFSACIAYNYYAKVVSKMKSLEEMIIPSLIIGCSTLPPKEEYLKYNKLFCLAVNGVHFIPKMMKNAGYPVDLIGGIFTICLLIDYTQYKKKYSYMDDNVDFKTFVDRYVGELNTFSNAVRNYGINEFKELCKKDSFYMLGLYREQGCTINVGFSLMLGLFYRQHDCTINIRHLSDHKRNEYLEAHDYMMRVSFGLEVKPFVVDGKYVYKTSLIKLKLALESLENGDPLLELYIKYEGVISEVFMDKKAYEAILVNGKLVENRLRKAARDHNTETVRCKFGSRYIEIVMGGAEDVMDKLTFPTFSACVAFNYYEKVVSKLDSLEEMIIPSLISGCSTLMPIKNETYLNKYNKLFCLAVNGVHFIPKMMKNAGYPDDLIGGVFTICILIDYTQYKKKYPDDNVDIQTFIKGDQYLAEHLSTFKKAAEYYGGNEILELLKEDSFVGCMQGLYLERGCTVDLKGQSSEKEFVNVRYLYWWLRFGNV